MGSFMFENQQIYYEEYGSGEPFLVLNGIFMTCTSWSAFVPAFSAGNRLLLLDFFDQGKSGKRQEEYTQNLQCELVLALLDHLKLENVHLLGISYGGEVAMQFAVKYPSRIKKLVLANTAPNTSKWLKDIGKSWEYSYQSYDGHQFFKTCIPIIYSPGFYSQNHEWAAAREELFAQLFTPEVYDAFGRLTRSAENHDVREQLSGITAPTLVISTEFDYVTPLYQQTELAAAIPAAGHVVIQNAGHAVMYEKPVEFASLILGFINNNITIQIGGL